MGNFLLAIVGSLFLAAVVVVVVLPLSVGYWYIFTGHPSFRVPGTYWLLALGMLMLLVGASIALWKSL